MIERKIVGDYIAQYKIEQFVRSFLDSAPIEKVVFEKNPLGERITIFTSAPGLVIGREGSSIKRLTKAFQDEFKFENPQVKVGEIENPSTSAKIIAKSIANDLSRFGLQKFRLTALRAIRRICDAGAVGCEIKVSGKIPSARAKSWKFSKGYLKKTGHASDYLVDKSVVQVVLKTGVVGIKVQIMLSKAELPDTIEYKTLEENPKIIEDIEEIKEEVQVEEVKKEKVKEEEKLQI